MSDFPTIAVPNHMQGKGVTQIEIIHSHAPLPGVKHLLAFFVLCRHKRIDTHALATSFSVIPTVRKLATVHCDNEYESTFSEIINGSKIDPSRFYFITTEILLCTFCDGCLSNTMLGSQWGLVRSRTLAPDCSCPCPRAAIFLRPIHVFIFSKGMYTNSLYIDQPDGF